MSASEADISAAAKLIWDYHHLHHILQKADCILVLGSSDLRVAGRGAEVFLAGYSSVVVVSGGVGSITQNHFKQTEAQLFADIMVEEGVSRNSILIEDQSTNTGQNLTFSMKMLNEHQLKSDLIIVVHKPYMERRTYATAKQLFPDKEFLITSPNIAFEDYPNNQINHELMINIMVGDMQRIMEYPAKGFQIPMDVPNDVKAAYEFLVKEGYDEHLVKV